MSETAEKEESGLISQDDIDQLLRGSVDPDEAEEDLTSEASAGAEAAPSGSQASEAAGDEKSSNLVSQDDIDRLLKDAMGPDADDSDDAEGEGAPEAEEPEASGEPKKDSPRVETVEGAGKEKTTGLVSQDEIDRLLKSAIEPEEIEPEEIEPEKIEPEEPAPQERAQEQEEYPERLILEEVSPDEAVGEKKREKTWTWQLPKPLWIYASAALILIFGSFCFYWFYKSKSPAPQKSVVLTFPVTAPKRPEPILDVKDGVISIALEGFVVPAPISQKDMTFLKADISLDVTTVLAAREIKEHEPFFRNIIYNVLMNALLAQDKSKVNEVGIKIAVAKALNDALPERSIKKVVFNKFTVF